MSEIPLFLRFQGLFETKNIYNLNGKLFNEEK